MIRNRYNYRPPGERSPEQWKLSPRVELLSKKLKALDELKKKGELSPLDELRWKSLYDLFHVMSTPLRPPEPPPGVKPWIR